MPGGRDTLDRTVREGFSEVTFEWNLGDDPTSSEGQSFQAEGTGPETGGPCGVCGEARRPEQDGAVMVDGGGKGLGKRSGFYFRAMSFEGSVGIPKCLNYLNSSHQRLGSDHQVIWKCSKMYLQFTFLGVEIVLRVERGLNLGPGSAPGCVSFEYLGLRSLSHLRLLWNGLESMSLSSPSECFYRRWWWSRELRRGWSSHTRGRVEGDKVVRFLKRNVVHLDLCSLWELVWSVSHRELWKVLEQGSDVIS